MNTPALGASAPAVFSFDSTAVRTFADDHGEPWFVAADVCAALEYSHTPHAMRLLDEDEKGVRTVDTLGGPQSLNIINESGLYSLILGSRKPSAKRFKKWVTSEVLPAIRKTGRYTTPSATPSPQALAEERMRFSRFILRFDPLSGNPQLTELSKDACFVNPGNAVSLHTFIREYVAIEQLPVVLKAAADRIESVNPARSPRLTESYTAAVDAIRTLVNTKGRNAAAQVLAQFGARNLPGVAPGRYPELIAACEKTTQPPKPGRQWVDPKAAELILESMRLKIVEMYNLSLITPEQAEHMSRVGVIGPRQMVKLRRLMA